MTTVSAEVLALKDHKARLLASVAGIDARIEDLETNGFPETGEGTKDEARLMKEAAQAPETATKEPKAERAVKPAARKKAR